MKKVLILGTGAMGTLMAAKLSKAGAQVTLFGRSEEQRRLVEKEGLFLSAGEQTVRVEAAFLTRPEELSGPYDYIIATIKAYDTESAMERLRPVIGEDTAVLTLQNGWGNAEILQKFVPRERLFQGTTSCGAFRMKLNIVRFGGQGETCIGQTEKGREDLFLPLLQLLGEAGFDPAITHTVEKEVFKKVLVNVGINALTAILQVENGRLVEVPESDAILRAAVEEGVAVGRALGLVQEERDYVAACREVCRFTRHNRSSMLQDVTAGRRTEVDFINGAIVRRGQALSIPTPTNKLLWDLVKSLEAKSQEERQS